MIAVRWQSEVPVWPAKAADVTMRAIALDVAQRHLITLDQLRSDSRARRIAWPRQEAFARIYALGLFSKPQIGRYFGGRDHTTVIYGIREHEKRLAELGEPA